MGFLKGKKALITGLISDRSIAYGISEAFYREGAELAFSYQNEKFKSRIEDLTSNWKTEDGQCPLVIQCDVAEDNQIENLFAKLSHHWNGLDILVHSIAFAPSEQLEGNYLDVVSREGFRVAHEISSYSFSALAKYSQPMMQGRNGALLTLTYFGAEKVVPNYNVMGLAKASLEANVRYLAASLGPKGIRVNSISAGPIRTLAASGIKDFRKMLSFNEKITPMRQNVTPLDVGNAAAFLCSDLAKGITGEIVHVDGGFHIVGLAEMES